MVPLPAGQLPPEDRPIIVFGRHETIRVRCPATHRQQPTAARRRFEHHIEESPWPVPSAPTAPTPVAGIA